MVIRANVLGRAGAFIVSSIHVMVAKVIWVLYTISTIPQIRSISRFQIGKTSFIEILFMARPADQIFMRFLDTIEDLFFQRHEHLIVFFQSITSVLIIITLPNIAPVQINNFVFQNFRVVNYIPQNISPVAWSMWSTCCHTSRVDQRICGRAFHF